jgi:ribosome-binding protein aMBF1 (putative translation factor)
MARRKTTDALALIRRDVGPDPSFDARVADERLHAQVAQALYDARMAAGLTQQQLAERVGTSQPAIARLEDADYEGHSLSMLRRVAQALGMKLVVKLAPQSSRAARSQQRRKQVKPPAPAR